MKALPLTATVLVLVVFGLGGCPPATPGPSQGNETPAGTDDVTTGDANSPAEATASGEFQAIYNEYYSRIGGISAGGGLPGGGGGEGVGEDPNEPPDPNLPDEPNIPVPDPNEPPPSEPWSDAVDRVGGQIVGLSAALSVCSELADPRLDRSTDSLGAYGTCPLVKFTSTALWSLIPVDYSYAGCSSTYTGGRTFAGNLAIIHAKPALTIEAQYVGPFSIAGHATAGTIEGGVSFSTNHFGLNADWAVDITGVGTSVGHVVGSFADDGPYTFSSPAAEPMFLTDSAGTYQVDLVSLVVDVLGNGNFVPESGSMTFDITNSSPPPATQNVMVTFTTQSPVRGTVQVRIDGGAPTAYQIPGLTAGP